MGVLKADGGGMTTAIAVIEDNTHSGTYTSAESLAKSIMARIDSMDSMAAKLKDFEDDIRKLWLEFDNLKTGETILGCATKKEFCEKKLNRTPRAIRYLLDGGNHNRGETVSPQQTTPVSAPSEDTSLEDAVFELETADKQDGTKTHLYDAASNPVVPTPSQPKSEKPASESQTKKLQRQFESISNPAVGKISLKASNVSSGVETSMGRYDLVLSGVTKPMLEKIRQVLAC
jgi:hypothetical protein